MSLLVAGIGFRLVLYMATDSAGALVSIDIYLKPIRDPLGTEPD